ncbi:Bromodomain [Carpediemonas membranifera]|uniref:Bromodomain n=1 Tax=Carpediemonas membranifera TaxID=201153 RepID=A0A8J6AZ19_9EUKA|nr:Bromodomain [Carpediemonas membranifera]|eukprot:KAG9394920.1 Bromodomain [Carpediemonas membranifera]
MQTKGKASMKEIPFPSHEELFDVDSLPQSRLQEEHAVKSTKRARTSTRDDTEIWLTARDIIDSLCFNKLFEWFRYPVDTVKLNIPEYDRVITDRMDLTTLRGRIDTKEDPVHGLDSLQDIIDGLYKVVNNATTFNRSPKHVVHVRAISLGKVFDLLWGLKMKPLLGDVRPGEILVARKPAAPTPAPKPKAAKTPKLPTPAPVQPVMTRDQRISLLTDKLNAFGEYMTDADSMKLLEILGVPADSEDELNIDLNNYNDVILDGVESFLLRRKEEYDKSMKIGDDMDSEME